MLKKLKNIDADRDTLKREKETILSQASGLEREIDIERRESATAKIQGKALKFLCGRLIAIDLSLVPARLLYFWLTSQSSSCLPAEEVRAEMKELEQALTKADDSTARQFAITKLNLRMIKDLETEISAFKV